MPAATSAKGPRGARRHREYSAPPRNLHGAADGLNRWSTDAPSTPRC